MDIEYFVPYQDELYEQYINRIKEQDRDLTDVYCEKHHIIPKCLGGNNLASNIIILLPQEHYYAHKLLAKEHKNNRKLQYAWWLIASIKDERQKHLHLTADEYAEVRKNFVELISGENNQNSGGLSQTAIEKMKNTKKMNKRHHYTNGQVNLLIKEGDTIPEGFYPGTHFKDTSRMGGASGGHIPHPKGSTLSEESKQKLRESKSFSKVIDTLTGNIYLSVADAKRETGVPRYIVKNQCDNMEISPTKITKHYYEEYNFKYYKEEI